jgi:hypothetical protein
MEIPTPSGQITYQISKGDNFMSKTDDELPDFEKYAQMSDEYKIKPTN